MTPLQVAAKFAAFVWYTNSREASDQTIQREVRQFAKENWQAFLPIAHEGLGRLLIRVSKSQAAPRIASPKQRCTKRVLATAG
jgi:hypothetical protein